MKSINVFSILLLTILFLCLTITFQYELNLNNLKKISNSFYSENAITFHGEIEDKKMILNSIPPNSILYATIKNDKSLRAVYNNDCRDNPNIVKGRFFKKTDYNSNSRVAVVGKNIADINETITFDSKQFKVIGVMGYDTPSKLDDYTWINFNFNNFNIETNQILNYIIDGPDYSDNLLFTKNSSWDDVYILPDIQENILYLTNTQKSTRYYSLSILIILLMIVFILIDFIITFKQNEIFVKKIHGYKNIHIIIDISKEFIFLIIPAFTISIVLLKTIDIKYKVAIHIISVCVITVLISMLLAVLVYLEVISYEKKYKKI